MAPFEVATDAILAQLRTGQARVLAFSDLPGWTADDHAAALKVLRSTADEASPLQAILTRGLASDAPGAACRLFEQAFLPVRLEGADDALLTGYYEPELNGSLERTDRFTVPLYGMPPDLPEARQWASRREIEAQGLLEGRGLELAWIEHAIDRFLLQVQGSGRIRLSDGGAVRVGYAGRNGHPYRSIGQELIRHGLIAESAMSAQWLRNHALALPDGGRSLMAHNPSYVFFRTLPAARPDLGPIGTLGHPVTAMRTIAVDPAFVPLGCPVWVEATGTYPIQRLMIAQDTGSAIKGPARADVFVGTGAAAGEVAGQMRESGRLTILLPRALVEEKAPSGHRAGSLGESE